jgi:small neutral amino acid transporter SnatA (MarC family)
MTPEAAVASFVSMMNPIGNTGLFADMTKGRPITASRQTARTCIVALAMDMLDEGLKALLAQPASSTSMCAATERASAPSA